MTEEYKEIHQFKVRAITRYLVTSFHQTPDGKSDGRGHGEFENADTAYQVAYALCRQKHEELGYAPGDERVLYPEPLVPATEISRQVEPTVFQPQDRTAELTSLITEVVNSDSGGDDIRDWLRGAISEGKHPK
jgi:hypothetical protein